MEGFYMDGNDKIAKWIKANKKKVIVAGACGIGIIVCIKNKDSIINLFESSKTLIEDVTQNPINKTPVKGESFLPKLEKVIIETTTYEVNNITTNNTTQKIIEVNQHLRKLPTGRQASLIKIEEAKKYGYELKAGQTLVNSYVKGKNAA